MPATATTVAHAYQARTTDYDGSVSERPLTAAEADDLIAWAIVEKDKVDPDTDRSGRLTITRTVTGWTTATGTDRRTLRRVVRLKPTVKPRRLTERQYQDLDLVVGEEYSSTPARRDRGRVHAGFGSIPPAAAERLFAAGWLTEDPDGTVLVSSPAASRWCCTSTAPRPATWARTRRSRGPTASASGPRASPCTSPSAPAVTATTTTTRSRRRPRPHPAPTAPNTSAPSSPEPPGPGAA
ncbi:hypothetical protein ACIPPN_26660 [Streptomyces diastaticus]|uniref:Uncharacterized protein n=1 Tax=Streptomyces diastaticus subsp. diastaticus TaxID=68040 RepID=A0ABQ1CR60_STRDI|nr:hypothetical protein [Streptomyces diastaticus]GFH72856.1 hypothetical protein Sdia_36240 [Streptomyces diastaticus subsp. diastaticus]GGU45405.1 hypothetical protein GCM10015534_55030 [Streptomyces diastaticus subsp. diastaticus]